MGSNRSGGAARRPSTICTGGAKSHVRPHGESIMSQRGLACVCRPGAGMSCEPAKYSGMFGMSTPRDHSARSCGGNSMLWYHNLHARLGRAMAIAGACAHDRQAWSCWDGFRCCCKNRGTLYLNAPCRPSLLVLRRGKHAWAMLRESKLHSTTHVARWQIQQRRLRNPMVPNNPQRCLATS